MEERWAQVVAPTVVGALACVTALLGPRDAALALGGAAVAVIVSASVAWRGLTGWPLVAGLAVVGVSFTVIGWGSPTNVGWFGLCVVASWGVFAAPVLPGIALGGGLASAFVVQALMTEPDPGWAPWVAGTLFTTVACTFARRQVELVRQLRIAQAGLADRTRVEERNRIAAEVHDVIGHALTVSLLHVEGARLALDEDPDEAKALLTEAERLARQSLDEVRAAVGAVRDSESATAPVPGATDLAELVESFRRAGADVELQVEGDVHDVGPTRGLALYRIVQESLTNAVKHGDGGPVEVRVVVAESASVRVRNRTRAGAIARGGHGLIGMHERAEALGGRFDAGAVDGAWLVTAEVPR